MMDVQFPGHTDAISRSIEEMDALRQSSNHGKLDLSVAGINSSHGQQGQGLVALLVMIAVLCFIMSYCCWGAPCCRAFCRRYCCCQMNIPNDIETSPSSLDYNLEQGSSTPTIILLPFGRMLVVDGTVFAQFQADTTGLDLIELGESVVRAQRRQLASFPSNSPSILDMDSETASKQGLSPTLSIHPPPTYDSLFGVCDPADLPPSYSDIWSHLNGGAAAAIVIREDSSAAEETENNETDVRESRV